MGEAGSRITLSMVVRNEASRYLRRALLAHRDYIDEAVIVDDASTDGTAEVVREALEGIPLHLVRNETSMFHNEVELRKRQWREAAERRPDWLLVLDADEWFERGAAPALRSIARQTDYDAIYFRLYDMWSETHYREDAYWRAHRMYRPFMFRYRPGCAYTWKMAAQHCGRFPDNIGQFSYWTHPLRVQHFGWAKEEDRKIKYERFMRLDGDGKYGWLDQYRSILDPAPPLVKWEE